MRAPDAREHGRLHLVEVRSFGGSRGQSPKVSRPVTDQPTQNDEGPNNLPPEDLPSGRLRHAWRAFNERDKQSSPRRSVRWLASWGFALPPLVGLLFLVGLFLGRVTSLSQGFLSTSAQVLPTLVLALAVQVGLTFTRFAAPLREGQSVVLLGPSAINDFADALRQTSKDPSWSTFVTYWRAARRLRVLVDLKYVSVGFGVRVHPAVVAVLSPQRAGGIRPAGRRRSTSALGVSPLLQSGVSHLSAASRQCRRGLRRRCRTHRVPALPRFATTPGCTRQHWPAGEFDKQRRPRELGEGLSQPGRATGDTRGRNIARSGVAVAECGL